jgi:predicted transport protein
LYEIKKFQNNIVGIQKIKGTSNNRIETFADVDTEIGGIVDDFVVYVESHHLERTNSQCQQLWENIKEYFLNLGDTTINVKKHYISIKRNNRAVCFTHFQQNNLRINILLGYQLADGSRSGGFFEISDPMQLGEARESLDRNGVTTYERSFYPQDSSNYDYMIAMLKQKYDALA